MKNSFKETGDMTIEMLDVYTAHQDSVNKLLNRLVTNEIDRNDYDRRERALFNLFKNNIDKNYGVKL